MTYTVLDLGAGGNPDCEATHCVDARNKTYIEGTIRKVAGIFKSATWPKKKEEGIQVIEEEIIPRIHDMDYKYNVDFNKKLPYPDKSFNKIVSHNSLAGNRPENIETYKNVRKLLKPGGYIVLAHGDAGVIEQTREPLKQVGFTGVVRQSLAHSPQVFDEVFREKNLIHPMNRPKRGTLSGILGLRE
jgi:SAM-dependent methyltransferase